jgi:thiol-disulfide isomerase/thioredoxin
MSALFALFCAAAVTTTPEVTLLDFRSDNCGPCRAMDPIVHELKDAGLPIRIVNVDREPSLAQQFHIGPIPCFVVVANGKEVSRIVGKTTRGELEKLLRAGQAAAGTPPQDQAKNNDRSGGTPWQLVNDSANSKPRLNGIPRGGQANLAQSLADQSQTGQLIELEVPRTAKPRLREVQERSPLPDEAAPPTKGAGQASLAPAADIPASLRDDLLQTSVRLILHDDKGRATGSGTVIDCREGEALILTCGHIFREWSERGRVSVDFFDGAAERGVPARVVKYNLKSDVALLAISTPPNFTRRQGRGSTDSCPKR